MATRPDPENKPSENRYRQYATRRGEEFRQTLHHALQITATCLEAAVAHARRQAAMTETADPIELAMGPARVLDQSGKEIGRALRELGDASRMAAGYMMAIGYQMTEEEIEALALREWNW